MRSNLNFFHNLPAGPNPPQKVHALVEIPAGGRNKYEYNRDFGAFFLDRVLYESVFYPTDYGFIPQTWMEEERDPLDIMVVCTHPTFPGCVICTRPIGILKTLDTGREDDKIIAVPTYDPRMDHIKTLKDVNPHFKKEIEEFWRNYTKLQPGKEIEILGWGGVQKAYQVIKKAMKAYQEKFKA